MHQSTSSHIGHPAPDPPSWSHLSQQHGTRSTGKAVHTPPLPLHAPSGTTSDFAHCTSLLAASTRRSLSLPETSGSRPGLSTPSFGHAQSISFRRYLTVQRRGAYETGLDGGDRTLSVMWRARERCCWGRPREPYQIRFC